MFSARVQVWGVVLVGLLAATVLPPPVQAQVAGCPANNVCITTYLYQNQRTGLNQSEGTLTKSALLGTSPKMSVLFKTTVDEALYAQPLYLPRVIVGGVMHNVIYVATSNNTVYAFDADTNQPALWTRHMDHTGTGAAGRAPIENVDISPNCPNFLPNHKIGVTGTPVIDLSENTPGAANTITTGQIYFVSIFAIDSDPITFAQTIYALDVTSGAIVAQSDVSATATGHPDNVPFDPKWQNQRPALLLQNGVVYAGWGGHCTSSVWQGWLMGFKRTSGSFGSGPVAAWISTPESVNSTRRGSLWNSGSGPAGDGTNIVVATGNGSYTQATNLAPPTIYPVCKPSRGTYLYCSYSESVVKLQNPTGTSLVTKDFFTPADQAARTSADSDLGAGGTLLVPTQSGGNPQNLAVQAGKGGDIFLINMDDNSQMGGYSGSTKTFVPSTCSFNGGGSPDFNVASLYGRNTVGCGLCDQKNQNNKCGSWSSPAWWNAGNSGLGSSFLYFNSASGPIRQFKLCPGNSPSLGCPGSATFTKTASTTLTIPYPSSTPVITSASVTDPNGVLWVLDNSGYKSATPGVQTLRAFDATTLAAIWDSSKLTGIGGSIKFTVPVVANGKVYVGGYPALTVFGLK